MSFFYNKNVNPPDEHGDEEGSASLISNLQRESLILQWGRVLHVACGNPSSVLAVRQRSAVRLGAVTRMSCVALKSGCLLNKQTLCLLEVRGLLVLFSPCQHRIPIFCQMLHIPYLPKRTGEITTGLPTADSPKLPWEKRTLF